MVVTVQSPIMSNSFVTPWPVAHQAPLSMGLSRQEYWSRLPFPSGKLLGGSWTTHQMVTDLSPNKILSKVQLIQTKSFSKWLSSHLCFQVWRAHCF